MSTLIRSSLVAFALAAVCFAPLLPPATAATSSTESPSFPTTFRGDWYGAPGRCDSDQIALQIGATSLNYFDEFSGRLIRIIRQTDHAVQYAAEYSAEGHRWEATETLRLSPGENELTLEPERTASRYYRCKGAK